MTPKRDIQICPAIIVIIAGTDTLSPACQRHTRFSGCVSERSIAIVVIEMAGRFLPFGKTLERRAVNEKDVRPSIIVIVNERRSASRCFDDVLFRLLISRFGLCRQPRACRNIYEIHFRSSRFSLFALLCVGLLTGQPGSACQQNYAKEPKENRLPSA